MSKVYNYLRPNSFRFTLLDTPNVAFTVQRVNLPDVMLNAARQPTPFIDIPRLGDKPTKTDLNIRFIVSEDMSNYLEIYNWMVAIGFPNNYDEFSSILGGRSNNRIVKSRMEESLGYSDATLTILDSDNNPKIDITYKDVFPTRISMNEFDVSSNNTEYMTADATFEFTFFKVDVSK